MKNKLEFRFLITLLLLLPLAGLYAQKIGNVYPEIEDNKIYIHYDLTGLAEDQIVNVSVYMSVDGGKSYGDPLRSVSGDVGLLSGPGKDRQIIWDVFADLDELVSVNVKFKVKADLVRSGQNAASSKKTIKINLSPNIGYRDKIDYGSSGTQVKGVLYFDQLGLGLRAEIFRTFRKQINYTEMSVVYPDTGYFWGYSAGLVLEYDFLKSESYTLYPFVHIGQAKYLYTYNSDYKDEEYFEYSLFGSVGLGYDMAIYKLFSLGIEMEYAISPWIDLLPSATPDEAMDGLSIGLIMKFIIDTK